MIIETCHLGHRISDAAALGVLIKDGLVSLKRAFVHLLRIAAHRLGHILIAFANTILTLATQLAFGKAREVGIQRDGPGMITGFLCHTSLLQNCFIQINTFRKFSLQP